MERHGRRTAARALLGGLVGFLTARAIARETTERPAGSGAVPADLAARLDAIESRQAITDVLHRYAQGDDRADEALKRSCFWPDATVKFGSFDGTATDFVTFAMKIVRSLQACAHHLTNVSIEIRGDRAVSECYYFAHHWRTASNGDAEDAFFEGRYVDRLERRNGVWKIAHRRGLRDYGTVTPGTASTAQIPMDQRSARGADDAFYVMLAELRAGR